MKQYYIIIFFYCRQIYIEFCRICFDDVNCDSFENYTLLDQSEFPPYPGIRYVNKLRNVCEPVREVSEP